MAESPNTPLCRPFFGYYGGKWRNAVKLYPPPRHETIVEPFAGSAGYAMRYYTRKVILCEKDERIYGVWKYLTSPKVTAKTIMAIRDFDLEKGETVEDLKLCQEAEWLVGFWLNRGVSNPRKRPSKWMRDKIRPGSFWGQRVKETIASQINRIKHWKVHHCGYEDLPEIGVATWFIDPPYQKAGKHYRHSSDAIDFESELGPWCQSRLGQAIVCENEGAHWLPFRELADTKTTRAGKRSKEVYWLNDWGSK